jgi:hypothetical protein
MMFTRGFAPGARSVFLGRTPFLRPYSVHSQYIARFALCHWSSSIVRGRKRWMPVPFRRHAAADHLGDRTRHHHRRQFGVERAVRTLHAPFRAFAPQLLFAKPVTTIGNSCGGNPSV